MRFSDLEFTTVFYKTSVILTSSYYYYITWYPYSSKGEIMIIEKETGSISTLICRTRLEIENFLNKIPKHEFQIKN